MNRSLRTIFLSPFLILDSIRWKGESLLWRCIDNTFTNDAKLRLGKQALLAQLSRRNPEKRFKIVAYLNSYSHDTTLAERFADNLIKNLMKFESQLGQDCIVDTILSGNRGGVFVEVGVGDGTKISNSYFLEKHRGWSGVLCEPSVKFHDSIRQNRSALLVTEAVFDKSDLELGFSEVIGSEELSTLSDQVITDSHDRSSVLNYKVRTISFNDLYNKYLKGKTIDYLSVDTEGSELAILKAIDFDNIDISIISVEHNYDKAKLDQISSLLGRHGYVPVLPGVFEFDAIFAKDEIEQRANLPLAEIENQVDAVK